MKEPLYNSLLKIERAKKHINDLHTKIVNFSCSDYYRMGIDKHPDTGDDVLKFQIIESFPRDEVALITGDSIHNLRSALDIAINDIVLAETGERSRYANFPIRDTRNGLVASIEGGNIKQAPEQILDLIRDVIKPYRTGGNEAICALHDIDIEDKHRLLLPTVHFGLSPIARFEEEEGTLVPFLASFPLRLETFTSGLSSLVISMPQTMKSRPCWYSSQRD